MLAKVVDMIDAVPMEDRDRKGDLYEYMLVESAVDLGLQQRDEKIPA